MFKLKSSIRIICLVLLSTSAFQSVEAKQKKVVQKPVYMIGVGISFIDSAVFITDIHLVDSVTLVRKNKFLCDRQLYSFQLQHYLEATYGGGPHVPSVFFSTKKRKMERRYLSLHKRYAKGGGMKMVLVDQTRFRFRPEKYIEQEELPVEPKAKKKNKKQ